MLQNLCKRPLEQDGDDETSNKRRKLMSGLVFLEDAIYTKEIWDWFHTKMISFTGQSMMDTNIIVFRDLLNKLNIDTDKTCYFDMPCKTFFNVVEIIFKMASGFHSYSISTNYKPDKIKEEIEKILYVMLKWAFVENVDIVLFQGMDNSLINNTFGRLTHAYRVYIYYMYNIIEESVSKLTYPMNIVRIDNFITPHNLQSSINKCLGEDKDEFIFFCIDFFINNSITDMHKYLAIAKKIKTNGGDIHLDRFEENYLGISEREVFNILFRDTFNTDVSINEFWKQHEQLCFQYFIATRFVSRQIFFIPWYNLFSFNNRDFSNNIGYLIDINKLY